MSRGEGMFTKDRYQKEYVNERKNFFRPAHIFQASENADGETSYKSPVIETPYSPPQTEAFVSEHSEPQNIVSPSGGSEYADGYLSIDETASMEELMSELELSKYK